MANPIQIKRSSGTASPASLLVGELAYSFNSNTLFIGNSSGGADVIAGQKFMVPLNGVTAGTLSASRAVVVDANLLIDRFFVGNSTSNVAANSLGIYLANSTSNTRLTIPTSGQYTGGNYYLNANGSWVQITATVAGSNTQVQFNDSGAANAATGFTFDKVANNLFVSNTVTAGLVARIGTGTTNTVINPGSILLQNSTVSVTVTVPTAAQNTAGNYYLNANGQWATVTGATANPGGLDTYVQFNDGGTMGGVAGLTFNKTANNLTISNTVIAAIGNFSAGANVGANVLLSTTAVFVGNSTANATHSSLSYVVANSTGSATLVPTSLTIGTSVVNSTAVAAGANVIIGTTGMFVGNSTVNTNQTATSIVAANSTVSATYGGSALIGANVTISTTGMFVGNTTANSNQTATVVSVANSTATTTLAPTGLLAGITGANVTLSTSAIVLQSNSTVNTTLAVSTGSFANNLGNTQITPASITIANSTQSMTVGPTTFTLGNSSVNTQIGVTSITTRDMTLTGNLTINGSTTLINGTTVQYVDNMLKLASNNGTQNTVDIGFYGAFGNASFTGFTGLYRRATNDKWYLFTSNTSQNAEPTTTASATLPLATFVANTIELSSPVAVAYGGTGLGSLTASAIVSTNSTSGFAFTSLGTDGQVLQMNGTALAFAGLDGGTF